MKRYIVEDGTRKKITDAIIQILAGKKEITAAYLHGSFADMTNCGDIDVAVLVRKDLLSPSNSYLDYELELEQEMDVFQMPIDIRVLNHAPPTFRYNVIKGGKKLLERDENLRVEFETETLREYFDFMPYRKLYLKEALGYEV